jgi:Sulfotransferase family
MTVVTEDALDHAAVDAGSTAPFFIVGSGRSGTTLLRLIIAGHSRIDIPPETWFLLPLVRELPLGAVLSADERARAIAIITGHYRWPDLGVPTERFRAEALALAEPHLVDVVALVYRHHLATAGKSRSGDKTPPYIQILPELALLYPEAKFIHLVRDGRDVALSFFELGFETGYRCYDRNFEWKRALRLRDSYRRTPLEARILDVKYEDLVTDPEPVTKAICRFLGERFEPQMLDYASRVDQVPERERAIHPKLSRPLSAGALGRWRSMLSAGECFVMEACLHALLRRWDYPLRFAGPFWRPVLIVSGWLLTGIGPVLSRSIPYLRRRGYLSDKLYL